MGGLHGITAKFRSDQWIRVRSTAWRCG